MNDDEYAALEAYMGQFAYDDLHDAALEPYKDKRYRVNWRAKTDVSLSAIELEKRDTEVVEVVQVRELWVLVDVIGRDYWYTVDPKYLVEVK